MFIDSHSHLFDIKNTNIDFTGIDACIVLSYDVSNFDSALSFCNKHSKCFCGLGVYPEFANSFNAETEQFIIKHAKDIVAIGEIGLDSAFGNYETQINAFSQQILLASKLGLPISVHLRTKQDYEQFFNLIVGFSQKSILHAFHGDKDDCARALDLGCYISFAGNITYKRNQFLRDLVKYIPDDRLLIETDSPSILPAQFQRHGENQPANIHYTAEVIAILKNKTVEQIAEITRQNAINIFKLKV